MKKRTHTASFKAQIAAEMLKEEQTVTEISKKHNLHPSVLKRWKNEALEGLCHIFERGQTPVNTEDKEMIEFLERKVGQLTIENDFLKKKLNLSPEKIGLK